MMKEEKKLPRPSVEKLNEYDELYKKLSDQQLTDKQREELMGQLNDIIGEYDLSNYTFNDPTTGKIGVKNPAGLVMVPAEYDEFSFVGDHNVFKVSHMAAKKDDKWGVVMADGSNRVLCDFRFDYLQWYPYAAHYIAKWDGVEDKFGFVSKEGKVFIPNVLTKLYEPWNSFMLLEGEGGKVGALDVSTFYYVLPQFDDIDGDADVDILFHKDGVKGYVIEETGEFVPKDKFEEDEKYDGAYVYNTFLP